MKKKLAAALLAAAMLMASLAGCGAPSTSQPTESTPPASSAAEDGKKVLTIAAEAGILSERLTTGH